MPSISIPDTRLINVAEQLAQIAVEYGRAPATGPKEKYAIIKREAVFATLAAVFGHAPDHWSFLYRDAWRLAGAFPGGGVAHVSAQAAWHNKFKKHLAIKLYEDILDIKVDLEIFGNDSMILTVLEPK
jgi:hypothetical protein